MRSVFDPRLNSRWTFTLAPMKLNAEIELDLVLRCAIREPWQLLVENKCSNFYVNLGRLY